MPVRVGREKFQEIVQEALAELPEQFRRYLNGMEVRIDDYPDDELMAEWGLAPPHYPFGMYQGLALPNVDDRDDFPGVMVVYERPLEEWCRSEEELKDQIWRTVYHELGHRFGFSEEQMPDELRAGAAWPAALRRREADRYLRQAEHDLGAAEILFGGNFYDWALAVALTAAEWAVGAFLIRCGELPASIAQGELPELLSRAARYDTSFRSFRRLLRLDQISLDMGDPGLPPPRDRARRSWAAAVLDLARGVVVKAKEAMEDGRDI